MTLTELVKSVIDKTNYMSCFEEKTEENEDKKRNVNELLASVEEFEKQNPQASLSEYLNGITLSSDTDEINDGNFITLATVHSVKGLEYRVVFVCGLDKEIFPIERNGSIDDDVEEERRLMYVAVTRARERLYITRAKSRFLYGSRRPTFQSEFLNEISDKVALPRDSYSANRRYQDTDYTQKPSQYGGYLICHTDTAMEILSKEPYAKRILRKKVRRRLTARIKRVLLTPICKIAVSLLQRSTTPSVRATIIRRGQRLYIKNSAKVS